MEHSLTYPCCLSYFLEDIIMIENSSDHVIIIFFDALRPS